jgi:hypothetical protein
MGEATYYGKISFDTPAHAEEALEPFKNLCRDVFKAGEYWQGNRHFPVKDPPDMTREQFWYGMNMAHPLASAYLKTIPNIWGEDCNNALAGLLDVIGCLSDIDFQCDVYGDQIRWCSEVWHFADWGPFIWYAKQTFPGALSGGYTSDEYADIDYYDMISES